MTDVHDWIDKLAIRERIESYMRFNDDGDADAIAALFDVDATFQFFGRVLTGRASIHEFFIGAFGTTGHTWGGSQGLFLQPRSVHLSSNPLITVDGDHAFAETDFQVAARDKEGHAVVSLVGRYRDRWRRASTGDPWLIECRTGVSVARAGEEGTESEWQHAISQMSEEVLGRLRRE